jgi:hypothetical protein
MKLDPAPQVCDSGQLSNPTKFSEKKQQFTIPASKDRPRYIADFTAERLNCNVHDCRAGSPTLDRRQH